MGGICTKAVKEEQRDLIANNFDYNSQFNYTENEIKTSHYTAYNFIFINLFEQFHRVVNIYFVALLLLQFIPHISSLNPITTLIPIIIVLGITAIKDAVDDVHRHRSDKAVNNRKTLKVKSDSLVTERWMNLRVGDVVKLSNNEHIPADLLLLSSSEEQNVVYIETADLDGETNLKVRQALPVTGEIGDDVKLFTSFNGKVVCEAPNNVLHKFTGNLEWKGKTIAIDNEKILLRGCNLRNTTWCYGLVIFAGSDTKLMQNSGRRILKRTRIERFMNKLVWGIFLVLFLFSTLAAILNSVWESTQGNKFQMYLPWDSFSPNPQMSGFLMFWSNLIILNTLVPISLYVSMEFIRLGQSFYINWDRKLYYSKKNLPAVARTTTLNEELGQVGYIFSDKTGTLTQNVMKFDKCSINGKRYGDLYNRHRERVRFEEEATPVDLSNNEYAERSFKFYDQRLVDEVSRGDHKCHQFMRLLALCHTVVIEQTSDGSLTYRAQSPDEAALVSAARNFGYVFKSRTFDTITVIEHGKSVTYTILAVLEFNNTRKRMSVIVKDQSGKILLLCKGADSVIYERLNQKNDLKVKLKTTKHLNSFARSGLRTLCLAMKEISKDEFDVWNEMFQKERTALEDREDKLDAVYEEIERDMVLLGATAIEDKLQDGVPETIAKLSDANIKIWVLTGDKQETAINIGYSCNMLTNHMKKVFIISGYSPEEVEQEIDKALSEIDEDWKSSWGNVNTAFDLDDSQLQPIVPPSNKVESEVTPPRSPNNRQRKYGLVITGQPLAYALSKDLQLHFLELASRCEAVICCRVTPLQKAKVVELVKTNKKEITLAIGDGANDVSMIKAAHIGVGISGEEGTQAVLSSDFSFGQFRFLERLLLVHGRWSYMRMAKFLGYFFYKNFAFTLVHFWFGCFCGFTAQSAYDDWFVAVYNTIYTATPVLVLAIIEQDVDEETCLRLPKLYTPGQRNELFNKRILSTSLMRGVLTSVVVFFVTYGALADTSGIHGRDVSDLQTMATTLGTCIIFVVTFQIALDTTFWTGLNHFFTWGSIAVIFPFTFAFCSDGLFNFLPTAFPFVGAATNTYSNPTIWFTILLTLGICLMPVIAIRFICSIFYPSTMKTVLRQQEQIDKLISMTSPPTNGFTSDGQEKTTSL